MRTIALWDDSSRVKNLLLRLVRLHERLNVSQFWSTFSLQSETFGFTTGPNRVVRNKYEVRLDLPVEIKGRKCRSYIRLQSLLTSVLANHKVSSWLP